MTSPNAATVRRSVDYQMMWRRILLGDGSEEVVQLFAGHEGYPLDVARQIVTDLVRRNVESLPPSECYLIAPGWEQWCTLDGWAKAHTTYPPKRSKKQHPHPTRKEVPPMKKLTDLTSDQVGRIAALCRIRGADPATVSRVAKTWQITESDARALAMASTTKAKAPTATRAITESGDASGFVDAAPPATARDAHRSYLAGKLAAQVQSAEARPSLAECSTQELEALALARFG